MSEQTSYKFRRLDNDEIVELVIPFDELIEQQDILGRITLEDGTELQRVYDYVRRNPVAGARGTDPWREHYSESAGVDPRDAKAAQEHARRHGVPTEFDREGRPHFTSGRHQARYLKMLSRQSGLNWFNKDGVH